MEFIKLNIQLFGAYAEAKNDDLIANNNSNKATIKVTLQEADLTETNKTNNKSPVTVTGTYTQTNGSWAQISTPYLYIDWYDDKTKKWVNKESKNVTSATRNVPITISKTFEVEHNEDGTLKGQARVRWVYEANSALVPRSGEAVTKLTPLTTIPRAKTISALSAEIGYDTTITLKQTSATYTATIEWECGELSGIIEEKTTETTIGWKIPTDIYSQMLPEDKEAMITLKATTFNGDKQIGSTQSTTIKAKINVEDNRPTAFLNVEDINEKTLALTSDPNKVVLNASNILATFTGSTKNGAIIKSISINDIDVNYSYREPDEADETITEIATGTYTIEKPTTNIFTLKVVDSRDNENKITIDNQKILEKIDYIIPTISATFKRNTPVDGLVNVRYDGKFFNGLFKEDTPNTLQMAYQYRDKESDSEDYSEWIPLTVTTSETDNTYGGQLQLEELFNYEKRFDFRLSVKDLVNDYGVVFTTGSIAKGKPSHWYDDENFYVEGSYYQRDKESGKWKKFKSGGELPIGSIYSNTVNPANPKDLLGYGEWKNISGVALIGAGTYTDSAGTEQTFNAGDVVGTYTHRHTEAAHTHVLNANGWAKIYFGSSNFIAKDKSTGNWTSNAKKTVSGTNNTASATGSYGVELGGVTGAKSATTYTTYTSTIQPSRVVYMWERIA